MRSVESSAPRNLQGRPRSAHGLLTSIEAVRRAPSILEAMRTASKVVAATDKAVRWGVSPAWLIDSIAETIADDDDTLTAIAAIHALGRIPGHASDARLIELIEADRTAHANHAAWALIGRAPTRALAGAVAAAIGGGGIRGMHAQRVAKLWARTDPQLVLGALERARAVAESDDQRRYVVETIGLVPGIAAGTSLATIVCDRSEPEPVRMAALWAFSDRLDEAMPAQLEAFGRGEGVLGEVMAHVLADRGRSLRPRTRQQRTSPGIRVAQVHLGAVLDPDVSEAGIADTGGVATLLSRLGGALTTQSSIAEVITIGRSRPGDRLPAFESVGSHRFERVPLEPGEGGSLAGRWPSVVSAERGVRRAFDRSGPPDVVHLRMADPGSLAAATVARRRGVPVAFTLAPDPHGPIAAAESSGRLDRAGFAQADAGGHLWFRAHVVERLARGAQELVLFPRQDVLTQLRALTGIDLSVGSQRHTVVPEGVDTSLAARARTVAANPEAISSEPVLCDLIAALRAKPLERHGLPIVVSVGRMHELKGMARIVQAFAQDEDLAARANLVIVGGNLVQPSAAEGAELARIEALFDQFPGLADRVVLLGHRPNTDVGMVLAATQVGVAPLIAGSGAYVCGSYKEEFGLAIVEALAAGLPVVAPRTGGPSTYVEPGITGVLVDTADPAAIGGGIRETLELAREPQTRIRTRGLVEGRFTIEAMARRLAEVYRSATGADAFETTAATTGQR